MLLILYFEQNFTRAQYIIIIRVDAKPIISYKVYAAGTKTEDINNGIVILFNKHNHRGLSSYYNITIKTNRQKSIFCVPILKYCTGFSG